MKLFSFICHYAQHYNICFFRGEQVTKAIRFIAFRLHIARLCLLCFNLFRIMTPACGFLHPETACRILHDTDEFVMSPLHSRRAPSFVFRCH